MPDFIYQRTVSIRRPRANVQTSDPSPQLIVGNVGYSGETSVTTAGDPNGEDEIATGLAASIEFKSPLSRGENAVPSDTHAPNVWNIVIPMGQTAVEIQDRDTIVDLVDGRRYQVIAVRHGRLGYHMRTEQLED